MVLTFVTYGINNKFKGKPKFELNEAHFLFVGGFFAETLLVELTRLNPVHLVHNKESANYARAICQRTEKKKHAISKLEIFATPNQI